MAFRVSPLLKVASSTQPQPAFGSWVTAVSPATGFAQPAGAPLVLTLGTAAAAGNDASQMFSAGEPAWLVDPNGTYGEEVRIAAVLNNTVTLGPKTNVLANGLQNQFTEYSHAVGAIGTGSYLIPKQMLNNMLIVYEDGSAGPWLYIGKSPLFTTGFMRIFKLPNVSSGTFPTYYNAAMFSAGNPFDISEIFIRGTANDEWTTSLNID